MKYTKECFGSRLEITVFGEEDLDSVIAESFSLLDSFQGDYSRFIDGNKLSDINTKKTAKIAPEIVSLINLSHKVSTLTQGYFDITVLPLLENKGYGIAQEKLDESMGYENIVLDGNDLTLKNNVAIEFGASGKGYAVDLVYNKLIAHTDRFVVNFGGDMRVAGDHTIHLEDPIDTDKHIGTIDLQSIAIASSGGNKRKIGTGHHLLNPKTKTSENEVLSVYVTHKLGVFADIFSTALFVTPLDISKQVLEKVSGLEALIILSDGKIYKSPGFNCHLTI